MNDITISGGTLEVLALLGICISGLFIYAFIASTIQNISSNDKRLNKLEQEVFPKKDKVKEEVE